MKIFWTADIHLGNHRKFGGPMVGSMNKRAEYCLHTMKRAAAVAGSKSAMIVLGDMFDYSRPEARLIKAVNNWCMNWYIRPMVLSGNHDQVSAAKNDTAVAALGEAQVIQVPRVRRLDETEQLFIPFREGNALEHICECLDKMVGHRKLSVPGKRVVLNLHVGISDNNAPYYLDKSKAAVRVEDMFDVCKTYGITHVMSGDWHRHQIWEKDGIVVCQVGSLCPSRFPPNHEHGHVGPMVEMDSTTGKLTVHDIPGPRFYKFNWKTLDKAWLPPAEAAPAFVKVSCQPQDKEDAEGWLKQIEVNLGLQDRMALGGTEISVDNTKALSKARTASFEARKASSLEEAVSRYVGSMPIEDGVDRDAVLSKVNKLINSAG